MALYVFGEIASKASPRCAARGFRSCHWTAAVALFISASFSGCGAPNNAQPLDAGLDPPAVPDQATIQGKWKIVTCVRGGQVVHAVIGETLEFSGGKVIGRLGPIRQSRSTPFALDESSDPKKIRLTLVERSATESAKRVTGVYELYDSELRICLDMSDNATTPKSLQSIVGTQFEKLILERDR